MSLLLFVSLQTLTSVLKVSVGKIWNAVTALVVTLARVAKDTGKKCIGVLVTIQILSSFSSLYWVLHNSYV